MKTAAAETPEAEMPCGPLKIGVIGANGKSGSLIARERPPAGTMSRQSSAETSRPPPGAPWCATSST